LLTQGKAILIADELPEIPENYQVIMELKSPSTIPVVGKQYLVAVPRLVASTSCPVTQVR
jgi:hypothetical protein